MKFIQSLALGLGILATGAHASSPILSVSPVVTNSSNLGLGATTTTTSPIVSTYPQSDLHNNYISTNSTALTSEVQTAPTTSTAGLAYDYATVTTTSSWVDYRWKNDYLSVDVTSNGVNQTGNKWISLTGSVQSTIDTTLSFYLSAHGSFSAAAGPFGSAIAPLLASFYFGDAQPVALSATTYTNLDSLGYSTYSSSYSTASFNLLAGVAQNFVAYVYAPTDVSVSNFNLDARTSDYDLVTTPVTQTNIGTKTLIGAHSLVPVPEPETYAMMLAGLGLIGFMVSRRRGSL